MSRYSTFIKRAASAAIVLGVAYFFTRALQRNWHDIEAAKLKLHYPWLLAAGLFMVVGSLLSTYAWYATVNQLSDARKLSFRESLATYNASGLTKYLPGKVWSYALQMYWLSAAGFSKSQVLYANIVNLVISLVTSVLVGLVCLSFSSTRLLAPLVLGALAVVVAVDLCIIKLYSRVFGGLVTLLNRWLKRDVRYFQLSSALMLELHVLQVLSAVAGGASMYLVCLGIGNPIGPRDAALVIASSLIADVVGFLAFIVPAGLGVREGVMYLLLDGVSLGSLPLVLPVASRGVSMLVDIGLGLLALKLLRAFTSDGVRSSNR